MPYRASYTYCKLLHSSGSYCNIQQTYETKGEAPERPSVKDYFSDKFSNNKASIVPRRALELTAGATARLTGPDSATTAADLWRFTEISNVWEDKREGKCKDEIKKINPIDNHGEAE